MNGGAVVARTLERAGTRFLFTLCGGHISPILVEAKREGIRVVDTRHEATAVFAADAVARLTGRTGVAVVTAGPGCTNTVTAVKNAQLAQSPVLVIGGATATLLEGRGSLQDIDQLALFGPHVKWARSVSRLRDLPDAVSEALVVAQEGVPGPVFLECPVDLLYDEATVRSWYEDNKPSGESLSLKQRARGWYLGWHADRLFAGSGDLEIRDPERPETPLPDAGQVRRAAERLERAERPLILIGSQAVLESDDVAEVAHAVDRLRIPVYLSGMARGLLGASHELQLRHHRRRALREADVVVLAGVSCDFRLDYGRSIPGDAFVVGANRSDEDLTLNRKPELAVLGDPGRFLRLLAQSIAVSDTDWGEWRSRLRERDRRREMEIAEMASESTEHVNPLELCRGIETVLDDPSVLVADGGDFVATASYVVSPRGPLSWLDPGVFGTLGVGAGFALGARLVRPEAEVWILYGDGSAGYSLTELDTFVRHRLPVIAVVGNDASWQQIAREQVEILGDDVATTLRHTDYHVVAEGLGAHGILLRHEAEIGAALAEAKRVADEGDPVLVNALIGTTGFRKGSISI